MNAEKTIIEVNGVKLEVDLRHARVVHENLHVGSKVKVLAKGGYGGPVVHPGVVVGFEPFRELPTIIVAYLDISYAKAELNFAYINEKSADKWDLVPAVDDEIPVNRADVLAVFDREILKRQEEIRDFERRKEYFMRNFNVYFNAKVEPVKTEG